MLQFVLQRGVAHAKYNSFDRVQFEDINIGASLFEQGTPLPGVYLVDVFLNGEFIDSREMSFHLAKDVEGGIYSLA